MHDACKVSGLNANSYLGHCLPCPNAHLEEATLRPQQTHTTSFLPAWLTSCPNASVILEDLVCGREVNSLANPKRQRSMHSSGGERDRTYLLLLWHPCRQDVLVSDGVLQIDLRIVSCFDRESEQLTIYIRQRPSSSAPDQYEHRGAPRARLLSADLQTYLLRSDRTMPFWKALNILARWPCRYLPGDLSRQKLSGLRRWKGLPVAL